MASKNSKPTQGQKRSKSSSLHKDRSDLSSLRIIGGSMRGRKITFAAEQGLRPTLDRIRETLFNWLTADIARANCLDLFAGSGALGFESLSRGAESVTFVDANSRVTANLKKNLAELKIDQAKVVTSTAEDYLKNNQQKFDLVFLDPPFDKGFLPNTLDKLIPHLNEDALVYVEQEISDSEPRYSEQWQVLKSKKTSRFVYQLLSLKS
jgi:16S rRNA (guanine966-N2)-methyltransferase